MERIIDRFDRYMKSIGLNDNQVTNQLHLAVGLLGKARKGESDLGKKTVEKILSYFQDINEVWLLTGAGKMYKSEEKVEEFADRLSEIILDLNYDSLEEVAQSLGLDNAAKLGKVTNIFKIPESLSDLGKFLDEYPEYNIDWILRGKGPKFNKDEAECLKAIKDRFHKNNHPVCVPNEQISHTPDYSGHGYYLWQQIFVLNEQLREKDAQIKEKDAQIKQLLNILQEKTQ